jgi:hypothetical protein
MIVVPLVRSDAPIALWSIEDGERPRITRRRTRCRPESASGAGITIAILRAAALGKHPAAIVPNDV